MQSRDAEHPDAEVFFTEEGKFYAQSEYVKILLAEVVIERVVKVENHRMESD